MASYAPCMVPALVILPLVMHHEGSKLLVKTSESTSGAESALHVWPATSLWRYMFLGLAG